MIYRLNPANSNSKPSKESYQIFFSNTQELLYQYIKKKKVGEEPQMLQIRACNRHNTVGATTHKKREKERPDQETSNQT